MMNQRNQKIDFLPGMMKTWVVPAELGNLTKLLWMALFFGLSVLVAEGISRFYSMPMNKRLRQMLSL